MAVTDWATDTQQTGDIVHNLGFDRLGSVTARVGSDGSLDRVYRYDQWGRSLGSNDFGGGDSSFRYAGTYVDAATACTRWGTGTTSRAAAGSRK